MNPDVFQPITAAHAWGGCDLFEEDPAIEAWADTVYVPYLENGDWGLFDSQERTLMGGVDLVFPQGLWDGQSPLSPVSRRDIAETAPDGTYIYGGRLKTQYGHFIVDVLSRQWPHIRQAAPRSKILVHHPDPQAYFSQHPFAQEMLGALGLSTEDFVAFDRPTRIAHLILPWTSFRHQTHAHRVFADLGRSIGETVLGGRRLRRNDRAAYLSKSKLTGGIRRFVNEPLLEAALAAGGVEILHPEFMSLADKVALFCERPVLLGMASSAFHHSLFAPALSARLLMLNPVQSINSNFVLIDRLTGGDSRYLHVAGSRRLEDGGAFHRAFELDDPARIAKALLALI